MSIRDRLHAVRHRHDRAEFAPRSGVSWKAVVAILIVASSTFLAGAQWSHQRAEAMRSEGEAEAQRQCPFEDRLSLATARPDTGRA